MANFKVPFASNGEHRFPTAEEQSTGFPCGPADRPLFHGLYNRIETELGNLIAFGGLDGSDSDLSQVARAVQNGKLNYAVATGTANALLVTLSPKLNGLSDGITISIVPSVDPAAGAALKVDNTQSVPILGPDAAPIKKGDMLKNTPAMLQYSSIVGGWVLLTSSRVPGQTLGWEAQTYPGGTIPYSALTFVRFSSVIFDVGGNYSTATGIATVKRRGVYSASANFWFDDIPENTMIFICKNNTEVAESAANTRGRVLAVSTLINCEEGDTLRVAVKQWGSSPMTPPGGTHQYSFSGSFIGSY